MLTWKVLKDEVLYYTSPTGLTQLMQFIKLWKPKLVETATAHALQQILAEAQARGDLRVKVEMGVTLYALPGYGI